MSEKHASWICAAAVAAALVVGSASAEAQFLRGGGNARDANNRVGSGGSNGDPGDARRHPHQFGNQIVTGNVTGGREFRGRVGYTDPREFRGVTSGSLGSDRFIRDSFSGATRGVPSRNNILRQPTAFYGSALATPPPPNYVPTAGATDGFIYRGDLGGDNRAVMTPGRMGIDQSSRPQELILPGGETTTADGAIGNTVLSASPLYGVREFDRGDMRTGLGLSSTDPLLASTSDRGRLTDAAVRQMREELNQVNPMSTGQLPTQRQSQQLQQQQLQNGATPGEGEAGTEAGQNQNVRPLNTPLTNTVGRPGTGLQNDDVNANVQQQTTLDGRVVTGQGTRRNLIVPPAQQSAQYAEMVRRMQRRGGATSDQQAERDFSILRRAQSQGANRTDARPGEPGGDAPAAPGRVGGPAGEPGGSAPATPRGGLVVPPKPGTPGTAPAKEKPAPAPIPAPAPDAGPATPTEPLEVKSLADGVNAKGLADLLTSAEDMMRQGKYTSAVGTYDAAARVAPNNPMITLGRSHAHLGAASYGQAENELRRAVQSEPALLLGRYDLKSFIGGDRLTVITNDLKELAAANPKDVRPSLLLAYLSYNTGQSAEAERYLTAAEANAGPDDASLKAMRRHWNLQGGGGQPATPVPDANK